MTRRSNEAPRPKPACVYCQARPGTTKDHVVPKSIYLPPYPPNLMTVKACEVCNNDDKSKGDTDLRDYLVLDKDGSTHLVARELLFGGLWRSMREGHSRIAKSAAEATMQPHVTRNGIYLGDYPTAEIEDEHINRALSMMVRGLSFRTGRHLIPPDYVIKVGRIPNYQMKDHTLRVASVAPLGFVEQGKYLFEAAYLRADSDPATSLWLLLFYDRVMFMATAMSPQAALRHEVVLD